jgi:hypothetical protein
VIETGHLEWGVLARFATYVRAMADGKVLTERGALEARDSNFVFPLHTVRTSSEGTSYLFSGTVRFRGHSGMLDLSIGDIEIRIRDGVGRVEIADPYEPEARLLFASGPAESDGASTIVAAALEEEGSELFFYRYRKGHELDTLRVIAARPGHEGD